MEYTKIHKDQFGLVRQIYSQGFYVEAVHVMHAYIENQVRSLLVNIGCIHFSSEFNNVVSVSESLSVSECVAVLCILNQLTKDEFDEINQTMKLYPKFARKTFKTPYEEIYEGIVKQDYDAYFDRLLSHANFFIHKMNSTNIT